MSSEIFFELMVGKSKKDPSLCQIAGTKGFLETLPAKKNGWVNTLEHLSIVRRRYHNG